MPIDLAVRVQIDFIGHRAEVVSTLHVCIAVSHNPLARLLEIFERVADFLQLRVVGGEHSSLDVNAFHLVVFLRFFDGGERFLQSEGIDAATCQHSEVVLTRLLLHLA